MAPSSLAFLPAKQWKPTQHRSSLIVLVSCTEVSHFQRCWKIPKSIPNMIVNPAHPPPGGTVLWPPPRFFPWHSKIPFFCTDETPGVSLQGVPGQNVTPVEPTTHCKIWNFKFLWRRHWQWTCTVSGSAVRFPCPPPQLLNISIDTPASPNSHQSRVGDLWCYSLEIKDLFKMALIRDSFPAHTLESPLKVGISISWHITEDN